MSARSCLFHSLNHACDPSNCAFPQRRDHKTAGVVSFSYSVSWIPPRDLLLCPFKSTLVWHDREVLEKKQKKGKTRILVIVCVYKKYKLEGYLLF